MIRYFSTNRQSPEVTFEQALFRGLAPDGGLYFPTEFPKFTQDEVEALIGNNLPEVGLKVLSKWFGEEIPADALETIAAEAQHFPIPLQQAGPYQILEIFHGPTLAFKDVAAQNLSRLMSHFLGQRNEQITLLVATSGDTGGAIAHGFSNVPNIEVYVLFPKGKVSALQEEQLTRVADNVHPVEVDGFFDDCQAMVKRAFTDPALESLKLTSANSISIGRLIPQIIYYVYTYAALGRDDLQIVVPSGNFGNLTGGLFAREMGIPLNRFIIANNKNDAAKRYAENGIYEPLPTISTLSNAMDVGNPSNFVRILELLDHDHGRFINTLQVMSVDDQTTIETMKRVYETHGYLLDPHTSTGWKAAETLADPDKPIVIVGTASPIKFAEEIKAASGIEVDNKAAIEALQSRPSRKTAIPNDYDLFKERLLAGTL